MHYAAQGFHCAAQRLHRAAQGLHYTAQELDYAAQGLHYAVQGLHYAAQGLHYVAQGLHYPPAWVRLGSRAGGLLFGSRARCVVVLAVLLWAFGVLCLSPHAPPPLWGSVFSRLSLSVASLSLRDPRCF